MGMYTYGTPITLEAAPEPGYATEWSGGCTSAASTCSLTMNTDRSAGVRFYELPLGHVVTVNDVIMTGQPAQLLNGIVTAVQSPDLDGGLYSIGTTVELVATPAVGYSLDWGGDCEDQLGVCTVVVVSDVIVTVVFTPVP